MLEILLIFSSFDKLSSIICFTNALPTITPSTPMIFSLQVFSSTPKPIYKGVVEYFLTFSIILDKSSFLPFPVIPA